MRTRVLNPSTPAISHLCDWSLTDLGFYGDCRRQPKTVFLQADPPYLETFFRDLLPRVKQNTRFILITGAADRTLPVQTDLRYERYQGTPMQMLLESIGSDPRISSWYAENLDCMDAPITPIPLGYLRSDGDFIYDSFLYSSKPIRLREKPLRALCSHRLHNGPQFDKRRKVNQLAADHWSDCVDLLPLMLEKDFYAKVAEYPFVLCVSGGGLDPSPKAWVALLHGAIPVMERNALSSAYEDLPVAFVDSWDAGSINRTILQEWLNQLAPYYEKPALRRDVLRKLSMAYWWRRINPPRSRRRAGGQAQAAVSGQLQR